eukprot:scaffold562819_cov20-Prasinocladus_malaysianus.AAC.1
MGCGGRGRCVDFIAEGPLRSGGSIWQTISLPDASHTASKQEATEFPSSLAVHAYYALSRHIKCRQHGCEQNADISNLLLPIDANNKTNSQCSFTGSHPHSKTGKHNGPTCSCAVSSVCTIVRVVQPNFIFWAPPAGALPL